MCGEDGGGVTGGMALGGSIVLDSRAEVLGGERESQGEAKFRAPPLKYSKYSYADLEAHVYSFI